ncbi:unnamed protein product [Trypanosoma congolense IL3000]|uniref:WGS project CAEQ00000000 data, annotated contig 46 n=1 Tax=Trypanosoma congolense (strain IL3000) TaxID=1068625 RepID=F9WG48_TRYCI|nr:unnamed protein product [Trypanosoma congolense IL3000]
MHGYGGAALRHILVDRVSLVVLLSVQKRKLHVPSRLLLLSSSPGATRPFSANGPRDEPRSMGSSIDFTDSVTSCTESVGRAQSSETARHQAEPAGVGVTVRAGGQKPAAVHLATFADVIPLDQTAPPPLKQKPKFSFLSDPSERTLLGAVSVHEVPNNAPKPLLPMWASSLTSPQLGKQRIRVENWISTDSMGTVPDEHLHGFLSWLCERIGSTSHTKLWDELSHNVEFHLRSQYSRGVVARKSFCPGDVIFSIPLRAAVPRHPSGVTDDSAGDRPLWGLTLTSEVLQSHSMAAQRRVVPTYARIESIVGQRKSSFDPIPHPLFVEQLHLALLLACERAEGENSPLFPYLRLLAPFDDDFIRELHLGVLDPPTHLEYTDHCGRFTHYMRQLHKEWTEDYRTSCTVESNDTESSASLSADCNIPTTEHDVITTSGGLPSSQLGRLPPPTMDDLTWALRIVLSRQRLLPLRQHLRHTEGVCTEEKLQQRQGPWARLLSTLHLGLMDKVFGVVDHARLNANNFDPRTIAAIVPVVDMLQHPPGGVANTVCCIEPIQSLDNDVGDHLKGGDAGSSTMCAVLRAKDFVDEGDELTLLYPRCYSLSYTLYRFGFLPLRRRSDDAADADMQ